MICLPRRVLLYATGDEEAVERAAQFARRMAPTAEYYVATLSRRLAGRALYTKLFHEMYREACEEAVRKAEQALRRLGLPVVQGEVVQAGGSLRMRVDALEKYIRKRRINVAVFPRDRTGMDAVAKMATVLLWMPTAVHPPVEPVGDMVAVLAHSSNIPSIFSCMRALLNRVLKRAKVFVAIDSASKEKEVLRRLKAVYPYIQYHAMALPEGPRDRLSLARELASMSMMVGLDRRMLVGPAAVEMLASISSEVPVVVMGSWRTAPKMRAEEYVYTYKD